MTKELEALEFICKILKEKGIDIKWLFKEQYNTIKQRLEAIDNAKPSEALRELNIIRHLEIGFDKNGKSITLNDIEGLNIIKQSLIKAQEQEKVLNHERELNNRLILKTREQQRVLSIIFKKGLPLGEIAMIKQSANYNEYNIKFSWANFKDISIQKTEEEFDLLKRWLNK